MISPEMALHGSPDSRSKIYKVELRICGAGVSWRYRAMWQIGCHYLPLVDLARFARRAPPPSYVWITSSFLLWECSMVAKRHHYVPQFYLQYFEPAGQRALWVYDKEGGEARPQILKDAAVEFGFYAIENPLDDSLEQSLQKIEDAAKPILDHCQINAGSQRVPRMRKGNLEALGMLRP
jgi:hypothetical protein